jgi:hypothetical protein
MWIQRAVAPPACPANWRDILRAWLLGQPLAGIAAGQESETLQFIEGGLVYRLPWTLEAIRVRAAANGDTVGVFDIPLEDHELGVAVPAVVHARNRLPARRSIASVARPTAAAAPVSAAPRLGSPGRASCQETALNLRACKAVARFFTLLLRSINP